MKALFVKDLRLVLRQQRATIFMFFAVVMMVIGATNNPMFGIMYTVFLLPSILISTIAYDTFDNGMPYIMTLPVSMKTYVAEKYLLTVGGSLLVNVLATGFTVVVQVVKGQMMDLPEWLICSLTAQSVVLVYSAIVLPVNMRYGTEKGKIILIIMAIAIGAILGGSGSLLETQNSQTAILINGMNSFGMVEILLLAVIVCAIVNVGSYFICVKWMQKKEY